MPKSKVKILEAIQAKSKKETDFRNLVFKVQIGGKDQQPINMLYDQVYYSYPDALIDFYESKSDLINHQQISEEEQHSEEKQLFDYDSYVFHNGSKILEYINSLTICHKKQSDKPQKETQIEIEKVYAKEALAFYESTIKQPLKQEKILLEKKLESRENNQKVENKKENSKTGKKKKNKLFQ